MPFSIRLDPDTERAIKRLARQRSQTRATVVREAIAAFDSDQAGAGSSRTAWEAVSHLIGIADSRVGDLSEETGDRFKELVRQKAHARRSG